MRREPGMQCIQPLRYKLIRADLTEEMDRSAVSRVGLRIMSSFVHKGISKTRLPYSTVTDFARFLGLSTSVPRASAV